MFRNQGRWALIGCALALIVVSLSVLARPSSARSAMACSNSQCAGAWECHYAEGHNCRVIGPPASGEPFCYEETCKVE